MTENREAEDAHYLAYFKLHDIPWKVEEKATFKDEFSTHQVQIGRGPYVVPRLATEEPETKAGGAEIRTVHENVVLEGQTYVGVAIPTSWANDQLTGGGDWGETTQLAEDIASCVSLCLSQRFAPQKVAEYVRGDDSEGSIKGMSFRWQLYPGARAFVSTRSIGSVRRALNRLHSQAISSGSTLVALRWHDQSKRTFAGPDRLVALWIALEALMGPVENHAELVEKTASQLAAKKYRLGVSAQRIRDALGLDHIRRARNEIIHEGRRDLRWPIDASAEQRDWPQILNDIVDEILRRRLHATPTATLRKHVAEGLERLNT